MGRTVGVRQTNNRRRERRKVKVTGHRKAIYQSQYKCIIKKRIISQRKIRGRWKLAIRIQVVRKIIILQLEKNENTHGDSEVALEKGDKEVQSQSTASNTEKRKQGHNNINTAQMDNTEDT